MEVFQSVILESGADPDEYFTFTKLERHTVNHFSDGRTLTFSSGREAMRTEVDRFTNGQLAKNDITGYQEEVSKLHTIAKRQFFTNIDSFVRPSLWRDMLKVHPFQSLHSLHKHYFKDKGLIQALDRYATYIGSSPYQTPATFSLIAHLELNDGVYFTNGGNTAIAEGFARRAKELGVVFRLGDEVTQIEVVDGQATEIELNHLEYLPVDFVVMNGDLLTQYPRLISETVRPDFKNPTPAQVEPSISAYVRCIGLSRRIEGLAHHNVFFSSDYEAEFKALFDEKRYAEEPTIYISNSSVTAPKWDKRVTIYSYSSMRLQRILEMRLILIRMTNSSINDSSHLELIFRLMSSSNNVSHHRISNKPSLLITVLYMACLPMAYARLSSVLATVQRMYTICFFLGGSTHPGGGSPMVTLSGKLASERIVSAVAATL
ncbi:phytoene desaturase [Exiguobacterium sp. SL14]|nr:FAD-dependent oxidoreductase [Exiguobacterium sp. SL14]MCY1692020.1 phytoene desaturase [Exiguobacterium sp. SL14]